MRKSDYQWMKELKWEFGPVPLFITINYKRISRYNMIMRDRVFDHNMVQGLCYGNFRNSWYELKYKRLEYKQMGGAYGNRR